VPLIRVNASGRYQLVFQEFRMNYRCGSALATIAASILLCGCATGSQRTAGDPLEPMNRTIYSFNGKLDKYVAKPTATAYQKVVPSPVRTAFRNFFSNLGDIGNFANDTLQLKPTDATEDLMRFAFNSTLGIAGFIDFATPAGLPKHHQDFGLTLAHYGVPIGPYLVLPLFGPSSVRDVSNVAVSSVLNPFSAAPFAVQASVTGVHFVSDRADLLSASNLLSQAALDEYSFTRDLYLRRRKALSSPKPDDAEKLPVYTDVAP
jgi:phospholipid-binding lipoprotein MlaA